MRVSVDAPAMLAKFGLEAGADGKVSMEAVDKVLEAQGTRGAAAIAAKLNLRNAGLLACHKRHDIAVRGNGAAAVHRRQRAVDE